MHFRRWWRGLAANVLVALVARIAFAQPSTPVSNDGPAEPAPKEAPTPAVPAEAASNPPAETPSVQPSAVPPATTPAPRPRIQDGWIPPNMPKTLPYHSGATTPPGYQFESMPRWGLVIPGAILFMFGHSLAVGIALESSDRDDNWLFVPVFGPAARIIAEKSECERRRASGNCEFGTNAGLEVFLLVLQAPGAALTIAGFASPRRRFVRNDLASLKLIPLAVRGGGGVGVAGQFF
jgi:hypothetical protein